MRKQLTPAMGVSLVALFFALTGGAFAAQHYLITSTKQIKPSVLTQLRGKAGPKGEQGTTGPKGNAGPAGPMGPAGARGAQGAQGAQGASGASGAQGTSGALGAQGLQGPQGPAGRDGTAGYSRPRHDAAHLHVAGQDALAHTDPVERLEHNCRLDTIVLADSRLGRWLQIQHRLR